MSSANDTDVEGFYVVAREPGAEHPALPTWANTTNNPARLEIEPRALIERRDIELVPGAFQLLNVLSVDECLELVELTEALGYLPDAAVSLPRAIRHNHNVTWVVDEETTERLWRRCTDRINDHLELFRGKRALGLNARWRFYRYQPGDYFKPHTDGAWPGSKVINHELITNAYPDRWSQLSFIVFLTEGYTGGRTEFYVNRDDPSLPARSGPGDSTVGISTPAGGVLCFPHGTHRLHCLHASETINDGTKYIIRTDVLFEL